MLGQTPVKDGKTMPNRLAHEKSPYLLQHAENQVEWFPWGDKAFSLAKSQDKPIFLSIGYATCHWCHVMAHESFESGPAADLLNRHFIAVKVDREERPDLDNVYMGVCQALTGSGGWPLSVFLTPDGTPFYAGTYFPPRTMPGRPGFSVLLEEIARRWQSDRQRILQAAEQILEAVKPELGRERAELSPALMEKAYWQLERAFDKRYGGFGQAPKFPSPHQLSFLFRWQERDQNSRAGEMALNTLSAMRAGGMFDQVGYGFHRYSVDRKWLVPHFEKMLYDQALLAIAYLEAGRLAGNDGFGSTAREIFGYVLDCMTSPQGAFYSAEDADSQGEEGVFYVWTASELERILGRKRAALVRTRFGVTAGGNFEGGRSILYRAADTGDLAREAGISLVEAEQSLEQARLMLLDARGKRPRPLLDDKVLTAWNGLMIAALARGALVLGDEAYLAAARKAAGFLWENLRDENGLLLRRWREGEAKHPGFLEDYAYFIWGLLELYRAGLDPDHLEKALSLQKACDRLFWDDVNGGYFFTAHTSEKLIIRDKEIHDGATPSGNSVMAHNLLTLARLSGDPDHEKRAWRLLEAFSARLAAQPTAHTHMLSALHRALAPGAEVVVAGERDEAGTRDLLEAVNRHGSDSLGLLLKTGGSQGEALARMAPFTADMGPVKGRAAAYLCKNRTCRRPITDPSELAAALQAD